MRESRRLRLSPRAHLGVRLALNRAGHHYDVVGQCAAGIPAEASLGSLRVADEGLRYLYSGNGSRRRLYPRRPTSVGTCERPISPGGGQQRIPGGHAEPTATRPSDSGQKPPLGAPTAGNHPIPRQPVTKTDNKKGRQPTPTAPHSPGHPS